MSLLRPLRLVETQLSRAQAARDIATENTHPQPRDCSVEDYETRRCIACGCKYPAFGFGPPLSRSGVTIWSCGDHRRQTERRLTGNAETPARTADVLDRSAEQLRLL